jgi:hypothetical protein
MPDDHTKIAPKKCFVISPIGDPSGSIRHEADWVLNGLIRPALHPEFEVERADVYPKNDVITNQVILAIKNADLIVADLTGHNPNVFYELAVAHAFEKPVVPMIRSDQAIPFDNHPMGTIHYSRERFDFWEQAKADLRQAAAAATAAGHTVSNPITMALGVGKMATSGDSRDRVIADLAEKVERLARAGGAVSDPSDATLILNPSDQSEFEKMAKHEISAGALGEIELRGRRSIVGIKVSPAGRPPHYFTTPIMGFDKNKAMRALWDMMRPR